MLQSKAFSSSQYGTIFAAYEYFKKYRKMFPHRDIHKHTWTSLDGKTHNQIDHTLIDRRRQSSILDVCSFRGADCVTDHYLMVAKVKEILAVSKQAAQKLDGERFHLRKLKDLEVKKHYEI